MGNISFDALKHKVIAGHGLDPDKDGDCAFSLSNEGLEKSGLSLTEIRAFGFFEGAENARRYLGHAVDKLKKEVCGE